MVSDSKENGPKILRPMNNRFRDPLNVNYLVASKSSKIDDRVAKSIAKRAKRLQVQMETNNFIHLI